LGRSLYYHALIDFKIRSFIKSVIYFTAIIETLVAILLFLVIGKEEGYNLHSLFSSFFHGISAFCTAGFSLYSDSFISYRDNFFFKFIIMSLSYCGAIGFIVWVDYWRFFTKKSERTTFTSKVILSTTLWFGIIGTLIIFIIEPSIQDLPAHLRLNASFFQVMTSTTTVGFNTLPLNEFSSASVMILFFFMIFGASPSGTGGGLKSTTFSALVGLMRSTLKNRDSIRFMKRDLPIEKLQAATASFVYFFFTVGLSMFLLLLTEKLPFKEVLFETLSALGTVGVSLGITSSLSPLGKIIMIILMIMGRVGILTFGIAMSSRDESLSDIKQNDLVV
jgi:trk system potassium uptake protein TrkH